MRRLLVTLLLVSACGKNELVCGAARECVASGGTQSVCLAARCAFRDPQCDTMYRWDDSAGALAGMCVERAYLPDAGVGDAAAVVDAAPTDGPPR